MWQTAHSHPAVFSEAEKQGLLVQKAESFSPASTGGQAPEMAKAAGVANAKQIEAQQRLE
jgi:hypothetical protein